MDLGLKGKVAIVTGGASGIGKATVEAYAREGANVVIGDMMLDEAKAVAESVSQNGVKAIAVKCDVSKKADAENLAAAALKEFGRLDILFANAGFAFNALLGDTREEDIDRVLNVMVKGTMFCCQAVLPHMMEKSYGKIVITSSIAGLKGLEYTSLYCATKFAVLGLTAALAMDVAKNNITVNAVCPGYTKTAFYKPMISMLGLDSESPEKQQETVESMLAPMSSIGKMLEPEDIAAAVMFLSSDVSRYMTGTRMNVSGGAVTP